MRPKKKKNEECVRLYAAIILCRCFSSYDWWCVCPLSGKPCVATSVSNEVRQATRTQPQTNAHKHVANSMSLGYFPRTNEDVRMPPAFEMLSQYHNSFFLSLMTVLTNNIKMINLLSSKKNPTFRFDLVLKELLDKTFRDGHNFFKVIMQFKMKLTFSL